MVLHVFCDNLPGANHTTCLLVVTGEWPSHLSRQISTDHIGDVARRLDVRERPDKIANIEYANLQDISLYNGMRIMCISIYNHVYIYIYTFIFLYIP